MDMEHRDIRIRFDRSPDPRRCRFAKLVWVEGNTLLMSSWEGRCALVDTADGALVWQPDIALYMGATRLAGYVLNRPAVSTGQRFLFAAAANITRAAVWRSGDVDFQRIEPLQASPVNAVGLSPDGTLLAMGTGYVLLHPDLRKAGVEIWELGKAPSCIASTLLSDVVVLTVDWHPKLPYLLVLTAKIEQTGGHLWLLEYPSLNPLECIPVDGGIPVTAAFADSGAAAIVVGPHDVTLRHTSSIGQVSGRHETNASIEYAGISETTNEVLLSTGDLLRGPLLSQRRLQLPDDCVATAITPDQYIGLTGDGVVRIWERTQPRTE
jgi:hypothetical protein